MVVSFSHVASGIYRDFVRPCNVLVKRLLPDENQVPPWSACILLDQDELWLVKMVAMPAPGNWFNELY